MGKQTTSSCARDIINNMTFKMTLSALPVKVTWLALFHCTIVKVGIKDRSIDGTPGEFSMDDAPFQDQSQNPRQEVT